MSKTHSAPPEISAEQVFREYEQGVAFKRSLGKHGMTEQNRINERFFFGDQWNGVNCGDNRPLVRHNVIKRIGDYKLAVVGSTPPTVGFSAEGVPDTAVSRRQIALYRDSIREGGEAVTLTADEEAQMAAGVLTDYFDVTAERLSLSTLGQKALRNAYITGTGVLYTYWDDGVRTGQYADINRRVPIRGDIAAEVLDIEQVTVGDPYLEDIQQQPYVILSQQKPLDELRRLVKRYGGDARTVRGDDGSEEPGAHATLLTRFWKTRNEDGTVCTVHAVQACRDGIVRPAWDMGIRLYPLAMFRWDEHRGRAYGESEIPYLIPNQIAINRTVSAGVWAMMMMGMPIMLVNGDLVTQPVSNDPGQVIAVYGSDEETQNAIRYVTPPAFSAQMDQTVENLVSNTMSQAGVSTTLLGDVKPDNASAILAIRESSLMPLQLIQNRYFGFIKEIAFIWAEFWLTMYGNRSLKIRRPDGVWYMPFDPVRFRDLLPDICVEVGPGSQYSETRTVETLDNLYQKGVLTAKQYLSRLPQGYVPQLESLLREVEDNAPQPAR